MSSIKSVLDIAINTTETLTAAEAVDLATKSFTHNGYDKNLVLDAASVPPVVIHSAQKLVGASGTINLAALPTQFGVKDATGQKLQVLWIQNDSTTTDFVINDGAVDGYDIPGPITVEPGGFVLYFFNDKLQDIAAIDRTLDWTLFAAHEARITLITG